MKRPGDEPGLCCLSFLLLTFRMGLFTMLVGRLRVLFGACGVFLPLGMIALAVMFSGGSMGLGRVFVMFCCFVMFVSSHFAILGICSQPCGLKPRPTESFLFALQYPILLSLNAQ